MAAAPSAQSLVLCAALLLHLSAAAYAIGVNYGTIADNLPPPAQVAEFLKSQTIIDRIKLFDANADILRAFANTGIPVTISTANGDIPALTQLPFAQQWVANNVAAYPQTKIIRILVGNEILHWNDPNQVSNLVPAMRTLRQALDLAEIRGVQVTTPHSLAIMETAEPPSQGRFREVFAQSVLVPMLQFLRETKSVFVVNPYPYFSYNPAIPATLDYALFKPNPGVRDPFTRRTYSNMFDSLMDAVFSAMYRLGYGDVPLVVGETGWPSQAEPFQPEVNPQSAAQYVSGLVSHVGHRKGTPLMPHRKFETYIFALFNENLKPGPIAEKNWGLFRPDFSPVYSAGIMRSEQAPKKT